MCFFYVVVKSKIIDQSFKRRIFATVYSYIKFMSKKGKLVDRFLKTPKDFHYDEAVNLLGNFGFKEVKKYNICIVVL